MNYIKSFIILAVLVFNASIINAKDFGTEKEARSMLERAINLVNYDKSFALNVFTERSGGFDFKDLYPFCANDTLSLIHI